MRRLFIAMLACICAMCAGCGDNSLMPTPNLYSRAKIDPFPDVPASLQNNHVQVLYLTDRVPEKKSKDNPGYGYRRSRSVAAGISDVEFGHNVSWKDLDAASRTNKRRVSLPVHVVKTTEIVRFPATPRILLELPPLQVKGATTRERPGAAAMRAELDSAKAQAMDLLRTQLAKTPDKEVYIFIHGYDNNFDDSVETIAQLWHFLGRRGVPVAYSWPAGRGGLLRGYTYDSASSEFTVYHLKEMIRGIAACPEVKKINIIAHSRGTGVVVTALCELHLEIAGSGKLTRDVLKLGTVVLAAPDIDLDVLIQRAVTVRLGLVPEHTVVYVCANDQALSISNWLFGGVTRLGAVRSNMFTKDDLELLQDSKTVEMIDCRISNPGPFGHSYFHNNPAVSSDLVLLLRYHQFAGNNSNRPLRSNDGPFWIIDDSYPGSKIQVTDPVNLSRSAPAILPGGKSEKLSWAQSR